MRILALTIPGTDGNPVTLQAPGGIPTGGLNDRGQTIIQSGITLFLIIIIILSIIMIIWAGIKWITSGGDKGKVDNARKTIIYALGGLVLALLAFLIVNVIGHLFGLQLL